MRTLQFICDRCLKEAAFDKIATVKLEDVPRSLSPAYGREPSKLDLCESCCKEVFLVLFKKP